MEYIDREKNPQIICTTLAQARELVRLGVNPKTADMSWSHNVWTPKKIYGEDEHILYAYPNAETGNDPKPTPCWSVGAMASLLPAGTLLATKKDESLRDIVFNALVNNLSK